MAAGRRDVGAAVGVARIVRFATVTVLSAVTKTMSSARHQKRAVLDEKSIMTGW